MSKPTSWEDGIAFLGQVAFHLRRLLPDNDASQVISRVEGWLAEVQVDYQQFLSETLPPPPPDPAGTEAP
jgi:hypothetical protein